LIVTYLIGVIFGTGIVLSGMANPAKVINFFDVAGTWDPSLAFVMGGALIVTAIGYRLVFGRERPLFEGRFNLPTARNLDARLIGGSAVFGIGWGIAGFCPGGALPALGTGHRPEVLIFTAAMLAGSSGPSTCNRCRAPADGPHPDPPDEEEREMSNYPVNMNVTPEVKAFFDPAPTRSAMSSRTPTPKPAPSSIQRHGHRLRRRPHHL
jgi:hypothetical protein